MSADNMFKSLENFLFNDNEPDYGELYSKNKMYRGVINSSIVDISLKNPNEDKIEKKLQFSGPFCEIKESCKNTLENNLLYFGIYENIEEIEKDLKNIELKKKKKKRKKKKENKKITKKKKKKRKIKKKKKKRFRSSKKNRFNSKTKSKSATNTKLHKKRKKKLNNKTKKKSKNAIRTVFKKAKIDNKKKKLI